MTTCTELTIDLGAVVANWRALRRAPAGGSGAIGAVLKADGYGSGAVRVAQALHGAGCRHFFTAHLAEALDIRTQVPGVMLAVLNGLWPGNAATYVAQDIRPVLGSLAEIDEWAAAARSEGRPLPALIHVDTGMNRLGLSAGEIDVLAQDASRLDGIAIDYVMTHLVSAEIADDPTNDRQRAALQQACARLPRAPRSLANSSGLFRGPGFASDLARPGAALYGINPTPGQPNPMRAVVGLRAAILQVRDVPAAETVGYNGQWTARRPSRIATVSVGYADGFLRSLGNAAVAYFDGRPIPLVGRVSMDLTTFDVTDAPGAQAGAWLELIGPHVPVDAVAERAGTNAYEILTSLGPRYARTYLAA